MDSIRTKRIESFLKAAPHILNLNDKAINLLSKRLLIDKQHLALLTKTGGYNGN